MSDVIDFVSIYENGNVKNDDKDETGYENIYRGELGRRLTELDGLGMKEVVGEFTARQLGATYFHLNVHLCN